MALGGRIPVSCQACGLGPCKRGHPRDAPVDGKEAATPPAAPVGILVVTASGEHALFEGCCAELDGGHLQLWRQVDPTNPRRDESAGIFAPGAWTFCGPMRAGDRQRYAGSMFAQKPRVGEPGWSV